VLSAESSAANLEQLASHAKALIDLAARGAAASKNDAGTSAASSSN
jgi:hypothetical protein